MFHRFTREARRVVTLAYTEARRMGHPRLGTEHLLLGLLKEQGGAAARALAKLGVTAHAVEHEVDARVPRSAKELGPADAHALRAIGIELEEIRQRVEAAFGPGALRRPAPERRGLTLEAKRALEWSLREAESLGHRHLGPEHILLGLDDVNAGVAAQILRDLGAPAGSVRARVLEELSRAS